MNELTTSEIRLLGIALGISICNLLINTESDDTAVAQLESERDTLTDAFVQLIETKIGNPRLLVDKLHRLDP